MCPGYGYGILYISLEAGVKDCKNNQHNDGQNTWTFQCQGPGVVTVNPITKFDSSCNTVRERERERERLFLHSYPWPVLLSHNFSSSENRPSLAYTEKGQLFGTQLKKNISAPCSAFQPRWVRPSKTFSLYFCHCLTWSQRPCQLYQHPPHQILIMR